MDDLNVYYELATKLTNKESAYIAEQANLAAAIVYRIQTERNPWFELVPAVAQKISSPVRLEQFYCDCLCSPAMNRRDLAAQFFPGALCMPANAETAPGAGTVAPASSIAVTTPAATPTVMTTPAPAPAVATTPAHPPAVTTTPPRAHSAMTPPLAAQPRSTTRRVDWEAFAADLVPGDIAFILRRAGGSNSTIHRVTTSYRISDEFLAELRELVPDEQQMIDHCAQCCAHPVIGKPAIAQRVFGR